MSQLNRQQAILKTSVVSSRWWHYFG
ncbi:trp operon leader peptide [Aliivibrio fischeri ES114]|uniref:Trp operon leader peptide n=2 Tax=Aliivibrio fischeri TaxID=668 RepID=B1WN11_ALIF1|nr:trp operon leader peptide [Aliivibrio fischeri ES114]MUI53471.1 hypothetical protein [Aliivibrio fischeri]MUJ19770.1 hypothetical protein [Aliivibrio fischeri]MUJ28614.1 hypothetical protein [Aliivibrio fischeri]MUJ37823.1 hypothetical protein [Aliivibrio fischeri]